MKEWKRWVNKKGGLKLKIAITGGSGFIGSALTSYFIQNGHHVYILTRNTKNKTNEDQLTYVEWLSNSSKPEEHLNNIDAFINLAGESINSGRWTEERKKRILDSRIEATSEVIRILNTLKQKPSVFVNASAIGFYGPSLEKTFTEDMTESGNDFLAKTTYKWEQEASKAKSLGIRTVFTRFGIVLDKNEGALPRMVKPYQFFVGGKVGHGEQWLSWVHINDLIRMVLFSIENEHIEGPINVTAPNPRQMNEFGKSIAKTIDRPHWIPAPSFALKLLLGEMSMLVLKGQKVLPKKALDEGFSFKYPDLDSALADIFKN